MTTSGWRPEILVGEHMYHRRRDTRCEALGALPAGEGRLIGTTDRGQLHGR